MTGTVWSVDDSDLEAFTYGLQSDSGSAEWFALRYAIEELALRPSFDRLITLDHNTIKELPHQIKVAEQVLSRPMVGRALLADEVGLGKTIEAGIVLKELAVRGLARRVIILTPASLVDQWQSELETKFFERFDTPQRPDDWHSMPKAIASISRARRKEHQAAILEHQWDLVIVDEAHKVKNHRAQAYRLVSSIERNYILLLTATPLQNNLRELYNLVTLLRPGQLGTWREFRDRYLERGDVRTVRNADALRDLTATVMVRTRRASVADAVRLPPRHPIHPEITLTHEEAELYRSTVAFVRELYRRGFHHPTAAEAAEDQVRRRRRTGKGIFGLERTRLCQRLCSSSRALSSSLTTVASGELVLPEFRRRALELADQARAVANHAKLEFLTSWLGHTPDRAIVFSEHRPTLKLIANRVQECGRQPVVFHGGMNRIERARSLARFRADSGTVFVASRAGTEGLNLQFCNQMVNYELPWNPMVVEQRIGRIHRIGQERESYIVNLSAIGTIEQRILELLDTKIRLFELVVGELDVILGDFGGADSLERQLVDAWLGADTDEEFDEAIEEIGEAITKSRESGIRQEEDNSDIIAEDSGMRLEREFPALSVPGRVRLGYGTVHLHQAAGVDATRHQIGLHVNEILEMLSHNPLVEDAEIHPDYGALRRIIGVTGRGREILLLVQADRLPMTLVDLQADVEAPLADVAS
jgi:SNF2 family DNA or RNA helicase